MNDEIAARARQLFKDVVTALSCANARNSLWWYTWLASRDRLNTALWPRLSAKVTGRSMTLPPTLPGAAQSLARSAAWLGRWIFAARHTSRSRPLPAAADVIIVSVMTSSDVDTDGTFRNIYFGPLPDYLERNGEKVVQIGLIDGDISATVGAIGRVQTAAVATLAEFMTFFDLAKGMLRVARARFNIVARSDKDDMPWPEEIGVWIAQDLAAARGDMLLGWMIERAMNRILSRYTNARVIHAYENNPWEHAVDLAARDDTRAILGYLHCAVLPSHFKNYVAPEETDIRPMPDAIICTGPAARAAFLSLGHHDPARVRSGCSLRGSGAPNLQLSANARVTIKSVIALLEGLPTMVDAVGILDHAARLDPTLIIHLRPHPTLPLAQLTAMSGIATDGSGPLQPAGAKSLDEEIFQADAVVYIGTTAVFNAMLIGVPAIKLVLDALVDDDPLFGYAGMKWRAHDARQLLDAIAAIATTDTTVLTDELASARAYALDYMAPASDEQMMAFLPG